MAIQKMVENGGKIGQAMIQAGYSKATAKTPRKLIESKGFQVLYSGAGLTAELLIKALVEDIKNKPCNRIRELEIAFKMLGFYVDRSEEKTAPLPKISESVFSGIIRVYISKNKFPK